MEFLFHINIRKQVKRTSGWHSVTHANNALGHHQQRLLRTWLLAVKLYWREWACYVTNWQSYLFGSPEYIFCKIHPLNFQQIIWENHNNKLTFFEKSQLAALNFTFWKCLFNLKCGTLTRMRSSLSLKTIEFGLYGIQVNLDLEFFGFWRWLKRSTDATAWPNITDYRSRSV
jgi:hypothetical protein